MENKRERIAVNNKRYYEKNREKIINHLKQYVYCDICAKSYMLAALSTHRKTQLHKRLSEKYKNET